VSKPRLLADIYETARCFIGLPMAPPARPLLVADDARKGMQFDPAA
jgi:hypothetical protein